MEIGQEQQAVLGRILPPGSGARLLERQRTEAFQQQLAREQQVMEASYRKVEASSPRLGETYPLLQDAYEDMQKLYGDDALDSRSRQLGLYALYEQYFSLLGALPWGLRRATGADRSIKKMQQTVKRPGAPSVSRQYWLKMALYCAPFFALGIAGEILFLDALDAGGPFWKLLLTGLAMVAGFTGYFIVAYRYEGMRLYSGLQRWIRYRTFPRDESRPMDLMQYAKMALPLLIAVASALIKQYYR